MLNLVLGLALLQTPNFQGIWKADSGADSDIQRFVEGGSIPYQPAAAARKTQNTLDPLSNCYMPGVPRIMTMDYPFHIFQTPEHVAITFEWSQVHRLIYTNGKPPLHDGLEFWMGDARGRWEGNSLVVEVTDHNDKTWFDAAGNFHSEELRVTERYTLVDADTIRYEATIEDPKVFTRSWKMSLPLRRQKDMTRIREYQCQADAEEKSGAFERDNRTWYPPAPGTPAPRPLAAVPTLPDPPKTGTIRRMPDGKPDISGYFQSDGGGANYGLERRDREFGMPAARGVIIDPSDGTLPYQPWARTERVDRALPHRGYDDPTAHCFVAGVPRSHYTPSPFHILQPPGYVVVLFERMSWRQIPLDGRAHLPDNVRLWMGDSVGRWEGDTLVVETRNLNGKTWLNEVGDVVSHAQHVVERFIPVSADQVIYRATVTDPVVYTRPWTIEIPFNRQPDELLEVACHEDNEDLEHLKDVRDEFRARQNRE